MAASPDRAATWQQGPMTGSATAVFPSAEPGWGQSASRPTMQTDTNALQSAPGVGLWSHKAPDVMNDIPRHSPARESAASPDAEPHGLLTNSKSLSEGLEGAPVPAEDLLNPAPETPLEKDSQQKLEELLKLDRSVFSLEDPAFFSQGASFSIGEGSFLPNGTNIRDLQSASAGTPGFPEVVGAQGPGKLRQDISGTSPNNGLVKDFRYGSLQYGQEWWDDGPTRAGTVQPLCFTHDCP